ncbi:hypothetical protein Pcinc_025117 [Petrolisthes cinctipes]|uniref:Ionotropic glutamate receptor L-glutamate and glycine-binding domain-containing protein n=1 Tax=Petrolisthes cinctipes TaxID=88211 RepID=A0AAE1F8H7_PETCI|nr:hypothetical protein Pcinc_025117 [Petrolisthes cinctipes]
MKYDGWGRLSLEKRLCLPGLIQVTRLPDGGGVKVSGPLTRILSTIATSLNTCVEYVAPSDNLWGNRNPNGNWTGVLGLTHRKEVDMTGTVLTVDRERSQDFTFSVPIRSYERTIVFTRPVPEADITGFFRPYTPLKGESHRTEEGVVVDYAKNSAWTSTLWIITAPIAQADFGSSDEAVTYFTDMLHSAALNSIPRTSGYFPKRPVPWWSQVCTTAVLEKRAAFSRLLRNRGDPTLLEDFRRARARARRVLKEA